MEPSRSTCQASCGSSMVSNEPSSRCTRIFMVSPPWSSVPSRPRYVSVLRGSPRANPVEQKARPISLDGRDAVSCLLPFDQRCPRRPGKTFRRTSAGLECAILTPTAVAVSIRNSRSAAMDLNYSTEELAFRDEVRSWLRSNLPDELRQKMESYQELSKDDLMRWHKLLAKRGWVAPDWPQEWGGTDWNAVQKYIFEEECGFAATPP